MNRIKEILKKKCINQTDFAKSIGVDNATFSKIVNEKKEITLPTAKKISNALGWGIDYIWYD